MEKRSNQRRLINIPIVCSRLSSLQSGETIDGRILNCCATGFYAELMAHAKVGTILVVRVTGNSWGCSTDEVLQSLALAEVRWSKPKLVEGEDSYATGLRSWRLTEIQSPSPGVSFC